MDGWWDCWVTTKNWIYFWHHWWQPVRWLYRKKKVSGSTDLASRILLLCTSEIGEIEEEESNWLPSSIVHPSKVYGGRSRPPVDCRQCSTGGGNRHRGVSQNYYFVKLFSKFCSHHIINYYNSYSCECVSARDFMHGFMMVTHTLSH